MKKNVRLIAAIINNKNEILLENNNNEYSLPMGSILESERIEMAYKRFVKEDIGLIIELLDCVKVFNFDDFETISIVFKCILLKRIGEENLSSKYEWYPYEEAQKLKMQFPWREVIASAMYKQK